MACFRCRAHCGNRRLVTPCRHRRHGFSSPHRLVVRPGQGRSPDLGQRRGWRGLGDSADITSSEAGLRRSCWLLALALTSALSVLGLPQPGAAQSGGSARPSSDTSSPSSAEAAGASVRLPPLSETLSGEAKEDYVAARILFNDGDFAGALVKFKSSYDRAGDPRLLWNMAACEKNLRHYANVLRLLERYEREGGAHMSPGHRAEFTDVLQTVRLLVSRVQIQVEPEGAEIYLDGAHMGTTPLAEPLLVDLGMRKLRIHKDGYKDHVITRNFSDATEVIFRLTLQPELHQGALSVTAGDKDTIRVDGTVVGQGSWQGVLPSGDHTVRVTAPGMRAYDRQIDVEDDRTRNLYVTLEPELSSGTSPLLWVGVGLIAASGVVAGSYFLLRPAPVAAYTEGTWDTLDLP